MIRYYNLLLLIFTSSVLTAQNIKKPVVEYSYVQLPLTPLSSEIINYQSSIIANYEEDNINKTIKYEKELVEAQADFDSKEAEHPALVRAAELKYEKELAAWEEKSLAEKVVEKRILNENNKPVKRIPSTPYKKSVKEPKLQRSYNYPALASTYLSVDGFSNNSDNAVLIEVIIYGFDYTNPRQLSESKKMVSTKGGNTTSRNVNYYHVEFTYRHTMSVKVTGPNGLDVLFLTPQELNNYKKYKSNESTTSLSYNEEQLIATHEEKIMQENLEFIRGLVNDQIGFKHQPRVTSLSFVKEKKGVYTDLLVAFNDASAGLKLLIDNKKTGIEKIVGAIQKYETALLESDMLDKKARIDKAVTMAIYFNLLECYFAVGNVEMAEKTIGTLNTLPISNTERKRKEEFEYLLTDLRMRIKANN